MCRLKLAEKELEELAEIEKNLKGNSVLKRIQAIKLKNSGISSRDVSIKLNCSLKSIQRWIKRYREGGIGKLLDKYNNEEIIEINGLTSKYDNSIKVISRFNKDDFSR